MLAAASLVGLTLGCLFLGYEPVGADPDLMYRPIKAELARALHRGSLPFWSDNFGAGVPLAAESHAAVFYPLNWLIYGTLSVPAAYRLSMWLHVVALSFTTYFYARTLGLTEWGGGLSALAFGLCGFVACHSVHEPFYHLLPYLPLTLGLAERYLSDGRLAWLPALALALGTQFLLGHFQLQTWTAGLVVLTAAWGVYARGVPCAGRWLSVGR